MKSLVMGMLLNQAQIVIKWHLYSVFLNLFVRG